jgi:signal transduction histidine kinase
MVAHSAERLCHLFEQVSTFSAMTSGQWDFEFTPEDLGEVVRQAIWDGAAPECPVQLAPEVPEAIPALLDRTQMQRVIRILLENASRWSPSQARVTVEVARQAHWGRVTVTDQGAGIDPAFLPHVFEAFAHADLASHNAGLGLSLAMARQIVLAHHGTIHVHSTKGVGTTFTVQVPVVG